jgi:hypothetical protein
MSRKLSCAQPNHIETDVVFSTLQPLRSRRVADSGLGAERVQLAYATIYSQCFHTLYFTEAGGRRKARENIGDFVGFSLDSKRNKHFVKNPLHLIVTYKGSSKMTYEGNVLIKSCSHAKDIFIQFSHRAF